jgi:FKBP-type peptidyl-prolyl cis-trans isomerase FkpA
MSILTQKTTKTTTFLSILAIFASIFVISLQSSCVKSEKGCATPTPSTLSEDQQILDFFTTNKITYVKDSRGFYYQIITQGNNTKPTLNSTISITYNGTFLNKSSFETGTNTFLLNDLITGWKYGLPLIGEGGEILLVLPSNLAYGSRGGGCIPPNTPLCFNIKLSTVK